MYAVDGIKMLGVSGVKPSSETIADGSYPYTNDFYAVVRADEPAGSPARRVLEWLLTADGQTGGGGRRLRAGSEVTRARLSGALRY